MSILAVDIGNSRVKWGLWHAAWQRQDSVANGDAALLANSWQASIHPEYVIASNVAGIHMSEWLNAWAHGRGLAVRWVASQSEQCGVRNRYTRPGQLGSDRWAALIGARHLVDGAALIINAGTAVTIDALTHDGDFLGGLIVPGLELMAAMLARGTAGLSPTAGTFQEFPRNTADAIASGAILSVCGAIQRMEVALAERDRKPRILLSGGAAEVIDKHLGLASRRVPNLVLEGLRVIATD